MFQVWKVFLFLELNYAAAFDTVDHSIMINRLETNFGIAGKALQWISSYLTGRTISVCVDGVESMKRVVKHGVPQGSVLGPILFVLYITPLRDYLQDTMFNTTCMLMTYNCMSHSAGMLRGSVTRHTNG